MPEGMQNAVGTGQEPGPAPICPKCGYPRYEELAECRAKLIETEKGKQDG